MLREVICLISNSCFLAGYTRVSSPLSLSASLRIKDAK